MPTQNAQRRIRIFATLTTIVALLVAVALLLWIQYGARVPELPEPPLRQLAAKHDIQIGNFAIRSLINEKPYDVILSSQFDLALADNTPNWYFTDGGLRPAPDRFNFEHMDEVVEYAESRGLAIQAHHLLWGEEKWLPDWLKNGNYTPAELEGIISTHIQSVVQRYQGRIAQWTVVNEVFSRVLHVNGLRDWWSVNTQGQAYIDQAFTLARQADPQAELLINDFNNEVENDISNATYDYIVGALARGVPIDGYGMQMHIDGTSPPKKEDVIANIRRFAELGLSVHITEFDVNMNDGAGSSAERNQKQARIYYDMARACIESNMCSSFSLLGITDKETWYSHMGLEDPRPLPFDKDYQPKPAFIALRNAFEQE
jgi:endo-1,4-beta-xylanase